MKKTAHIYPRFIGNASLKENSEHQLENLNRQILKNFEEGLSHKEIVMKLKEKGFSRSDLYRRVLTLKN